MEKQQKRFEGKSKVGKQKVKERSLMAQRHFHLTNGNGKYGYTRCHKCQRKVNFYVYNRNATMRRVRRSRQTKMVRDSWKDDRMQNEKIFYPIMQISLS